MTVAQRPGLSRRGRRRDAPQKVSATKVSLVGAELGTVPGNDVEKCLRSTSCYAPSSVRVDATARGGPSDVKLTIVSAGDARTSIG